MLFGPFNLGPDGQMGTAFRNPIRMTYGGITFKKCSAWTSNFLNLTDRRGKNAYTDSNVQNQTCNYGHK